MGDLIVTCWSRNGRNRRAGELIARGATPDEAAAEIGKVVEGLTTAPVLRDLSHRLGIELPITEAVCAVLSGMPRSDLLASLMGRRRPGYTERVKALARSGARSAIALAGCGGNDTAAARRRSGSRPRPSAHRLRELDSSLDSDQWTRCRRCSTASRAGRSSSSSSTSSSPRSSSQWERDVEPALGDTVAAICARRSRGRRRDAARRRGEARTRCSTSSPTRPTRSTCRRGRRLDGRRREETARSIDALTSGDGELADDDG